MDVDYDSDYSENYNSKKVPKSKVVKRAESSILQPTASQSCSQAIEEIYQKKSQLEHILLRPDTYVGSTEKQIQKLWVHDGVNLQEKEISYVPGLYKIFDEILVNAADNKIRDPKMDAVKVYIDKETNRITIWNNGDGVPVEIHKEEKIYVPEMIFGHLLTSSNYDDTQKKITGGRNGYGAKLANIFSKEFIIETCDGSRKRRYKQIFRDNMSSKNEPKITVCKPGENWTSVSFSPDLSKFGMDELEEDTVSLMRKRVYDLAGVLGKTVKVYLNDTQVPIKEFRDYVKLYIKAIEAMERAERTAKGKMDLTLEESHEIKTVYERNERWEVVFCASNAGFHQVSFVNSICTIKGGTHVNYVVDQVTKGLIEALQKKDKKCKLKPYMVKNHMMVFVNCMIENPAFDSQTKESLTLRASSFGSKFEMEPRVLKKIGEECGINAMVAEFAAFKSNKELKKTDGSKRSKVLDQSKLLDAADAGSNRSSHCTLILTEGDSAKSLVVEGLGVAGRDKFGVFPLKGKLLNVRDASATMIAKNSEIESIKKIMGLQQGKVYDSVKDLRYGHLMIMTDQDHDGSHIKGLIMNLIHHFWPSLLRLPGFLLEFITPIVKATKGRQVRSFYTMPEYEEWSHSLQNASSWKIKYYKGLGTSTAQEAQEYFGDVDHHKKTFKWTGDGDAEALELAFSKKKVEDRKLWLAGYVEGTYLDQSQEEITYSEFVNKELILFSRADLERSIPSQVDGFKPGQRKIMFACFKKNQAADIKVAQLSGYVAEHSAYHHGEASLQGTIVGLAQGFVGSNNLNLLFPSGSFGTRFQGGKDAASARYIYTRLASVTRAIFRKDDEKLLDYLQEEGQSIEPKWYMPVIPTVLVNGAEGIGTGWSTSIPNFNPRDLVANLKRLLRGEETLPMQPWYRGFRGSIQEIASNVAGKTYSCCGLIRKEGDVVHIEELPVRHWTQPYKEWLVSLSAEDAPGGALVTDIKEWHSGTTVHFEVHCRPGALDGLSHDDLLAKFKLTSRLTLGNMTLFNKDGVVKRYSGPDEILEEFYELRKIYYERRRLWLIESAEAELKLLSNKVRFIRCCDSGEIELRKRRQADLEAQLFSMNFDKISPPSKKAPTVAASAGVEGSANEKEEEEAEAGGYAYLLNMAISSLTVEKAEQLEAEKSRQAAKVEEARNTTPEIMYMCDLDALEQALDEFDEADRDAAEANDAMVKKSRAAQRRGASKAKAPKVRKKKYSSMDSEDDSDDLDEDSDDDFTQTKSKSRAPAARPPAARPPAAKPAAKPPNPVLKQSTLTSLGMGTGKVVSNKAGKPPVVKKAASGQPAVKASQTSTSALPPDPSEGSLFERLRGGIQQMSMASESSELGQQSMAATSSAGISKAPGGQSRPPAKKKPAAKKRQEWDSMSDSQPDSLDLRSESESEDEKPKASKKAAAAKHAAKRKLAAKPAPSAVSRLQKESETEQCSSAESPLPAHQGKVRKMRPSPFHKGSGEPKTTFEDALDIKPEAPERSLASTRPARNAAAKSKSSTVVLSSSEDEDHLSEDEGDSEYQASD